MPPLAARGGRGTYSCPTAVYFVAWVFPSIRILPALRSVRKAALRLAALVSK